MLEPEEMAICPRCARVYPRGLGLVIQPHGGDFGDQDDCERVFAEPFASYVRDYAQAKVLEAQREAVRLAEGGEDHSVDWAMGYEAGLEAQREPPGR